MLLTTAKIQLSEGPHDETMGSSYFCLGSVVFGQPWRLKD